jgi:guanylate kinase
VTDGLAAGKWVLLEIDVEGALSVLEEMPDAVTIFLHPGSMAELEKRLRERGTETPESLARRLKVARQEMESIDQYQYEVINDTVDQAVAEICKILKESGE